MSGGEFENREGGQLGELPEDILRERGELQSFGLEAPAPPPAWDQKYQQDVLKLPGVIGAPPDASQVVSTFDARPINAYDFIGNGGTLVEGV